MCHGGGSSQREFVQSDLIFPCLYFDGLHRIMCPVRIPVAVSAKAAFREFDIRDDTYTKSDTMFRQRSDISVSVSRNSDNEYIIAFFYDEKFDIFFKHTIIVAYCFLMYFCFFFLNEN